MHIRYLHIAVSIILFNIFNVSNGQALKMLKEQPAEIPKEYAGKVELLWPTDVPQQNHGLDLNIQDWSTAQRYFKWLCENDATGYSNNPETPSKEIGIFDLRFSHHDLHYTRKEIVSAAEQSPGWLVTAKITPQLNIRANQIDYVESPIRQISESIFNSFYEIPAPKPNVTYELAKELRLYTETFLPMRVESKESPNQPRSDNPNLTTGQLTLVIDFSKSFFVEREATEYDLTRWPQLKTFKYARFSINTLQNEEWDRSNWPIVRIKGKFNITDLYSVHGTNEIKSQFAIVWRGIERTPLAGC